MLQFGYAFKEASVIDSHSLITAIVFPPLMGLLLFGQSAADWSYIMAEKTLMYKSRPLNRKDNVIYYGFPSDKYIIRLQIAETKKVKDMDVATKVDVMLQLTDSEIKHRDRVVKRTQKNGLYEAMDIADIWLTRALAG